MSKDFHQFDWDLATQDDCRRLIRLAIREDLERANDWTTVLLVPEGAAGRASIVARAAGIVAGLPAVQTAIDELDPRIGLRPCVEDGCAVRRGDKLAVLDGPARGLLTAERPILNLLGHLSGIATLTGRYVAAVATTTARIYDTRKTTPGWRRLEKYAVRRGGGHNHRTGLFDAILIKDNRLALGRQAGQPFTPAEAVRRAREFVAQFPAGDPRREMIVEIEVDSLAQLEEVLPELPDIVLLDNMPPAALRRAVDIRDAREPRIELEASGGVTLETVAEIARGGVDRISVGALTHSARWFDVALDWE